MDDGRQTTDEGCGPSRNQKLGMGRFEMRDGEMGRLETASPIRPTSHVPLPTSHPIDLQIDNLVLHGFPPGDRARIGEAVERELARLIAERGLPSSLARGGEMARLDGGQFSIAAGAPVGHIGAQLAQVLYRSLE